MPSLTPDPFESRLLALAERGFGIALNVRREPYGQQRGQVTFDIRLQKGDTFAGSGMTVNGTGRTLDDAASAALRAAETFLADPEPGVAVEGALGDMAAALPAIAAE